jgi:hypothetical protein
MNSHRTSVLILYHPNSVAFMEMKPLAVHLHEVASSFEFELERPKKRFIDPSHPVSVSLVVF